MLNKKEWLQEGILFSYETFFHLYFASLVAHFDLELVQGMEKQLSCMVIWNRMVLRLPEKEELVYKL